MSGGPLQGIRVLDLTSVVMGPVATQFFADYGADVVKIEPPEGDLLRTLGGKSVTPKMASKFLHMNRNKRSIVLDLKQPAARGALKRLGLGYDELSAANGKLVYCSLVGFGQSGRYAAKPAYDTIIQGSAGVAACHARSTGTPRYTPMVMADHIVGLIAVQMVLLALVHRQTTGAGQHIEVPMFENMAAFVMAEHMYLRTFDPPLGGTGDPRVLEPEARPLPTADGFICVSANTDKQAFAFFDAVGRPELKADRRFESVAARFENVRDYFEVRAQSLRSKTTGEWLELLERADVPCMPYHTFESLLDDPHLREVGTFERVVHPTEGAIWNIALPNRLASGARSDYLPAPKLGQHTREVLSEAGLSEKEIEDLAAGSPPAGKTSREVR